MQELGDDAAGEIGAVPKRDCRRNDKGEKVPRVGMTHAVVYPHAVVVHLGDAAAA